MAAEMLHFREYADFADYFGSRWHYYLGDIIAGIPMPFVFAPGLFPKRNCGKSAALVCRGAVAIFGRCDEKENGHGAIGFAAEIHRYCV